MASATEHWDRVHGTTVPERTGWFEAEPALSLELIARCGIGADDPIVDVGTGTSSLIDRLLERGHRRLVAVDISPIALSILRERVGEEAAGSVRFVVDDVAHPTELARLRDVALWHDRAALHFLVDDEDRRRYAETVGQAVRPGGFVILAAFALDGAERCSGLPVQRYDAALLGELLGAEFRLIESRGHVHTNPSGQPRPYVYARFRHG